MLVKLQRPFPVIIIFLPGLGIFSSTVTFPASPFCLKNPAAPAAAASPAAPPPTMIMSSMNVLKLYVDKILNSF